MARQVQYAPDLAIPISGVHLAALLHIGPQQLIRLTEAGVIRRGEDKDGRPMVGVYRLDQAIGDFADHWKKEALGRGRHAFEEARARHEQIKTAAAELRLRQTHGELVPVDGLLEIVGAMCLRFRAKLVSVIPRIVRTAFHAPSLEEALTKGEALSDEILGELRALKKSDLTKPKLRVIHESADSAED